jgi:hypothetical protein
MNSIITIVLVSLCCVLSSCSPVNSITRYGITARMIDADSKQPIARTETKIVADGIAFDKTSTEDGLIAVPAKRQLKLSWLGGPVVHNHLEAAMEIEPDGYLRTRFRWAPHLPEHSSSNFIETNGVVDVGTIEMKKR